MWWNSNFFPSYSLVFGNIENFTTVFGPMLTEVEVRVAFKISCNSEWSKRNLSLIYMASLSCCHFQSACSQGHFLQSPKISDDKLEASFLQISAENKFSDLNMVSSVAAILLTKDTVGPWQSPPHLYSLLDFPDGVRVSFLKNFSFLLDCLCWIPHFFLAKKREIILNPL